MQALSYDNRLGKILVKRAKEKLLNLNKYMPGEEPLFYQFAGSLGKGLDRHLVFPSGFCVQALSALPYLEDNSEQSTKGGKSTKGKKAKSSHDIQYYYKTLFTRIPEIAELIFPKKFADDVKEYHQRIEQGHLEKIQLSRYYY